MVNKGNSAIWRAGASDTTSTSTSEPSSGGSFDKIEFDLDAVTPDATGHITTTQGEIKTGVAENEAPFRDVNELQFTGVETITVIITGHIQNPDSSVVETTLKVWALEPQKTSTYTKGKFGMRLNDFPIFSIKPYSTVSGHARGVSFESIKWIRPIDQRGRLDIIIIARISGDVLGGLSAPYNWSV